MTLCVNDSGTWRNATTLCVNDSGTWRNIVIGTINQSSTWRTFLDKRPPGCCPFTTSCSLGSNVAGGFLICKSSNVAWIVAPSSSEVSRTWYCRNDAITRAQQVSQCTGWFIPTIGQLQNPGYACRTYWDSFSYNSCYWSNTVVNSDNSRGMWMCPYGGSVATYSNSSIFCVRTFRCVTY